MKFLMYRTELRFLKPKTAINKADLISYFLFSLGGLVVVVSLLVFLILMHLQCDKASFYSAIATLVAALFAFIVQFTVLLRNKVLSGIQRKTETYRTYEKLCIKYKMDDTFITSCLNKINSQCFSDLHFRLCNPCKKNPKNGRLSVEYILVGTVRNHPKIPTDYSTILHQFFANQQATTVDEFFEKAYSLANVIREIINKYFSKEYDKSLFNKFLKSIVYEYCFYLIPFIDLIKGDVEILTDLAYYAYTYSKGGIL